MYVRTYKEICVYMLRFAVFFKMSFPHFDENERYVRRDGSTDVYKINNFCPMPSNFWTY